MRRGQALVEFALVAPVLIAFMLVIGELGFLAVRVIGWQQMTGAVAEAAEGALPAWTADELARRGCAGPAEYLAGDPPHVRVHCHYSLLLVNGAGFPATFEAIAREEGSPSPVP